MKCVRFAWQCTSEKKPVFHRNGFAPGVTNYDYIITMQNYIKKKQPCVLLRHTSKQEFLNTWPMTSNATAAW